MAKTEKLDFLPLGDDEPGDKPKSERRPAPPSAADRLPHTGDATPLLEEADLSAESVLPPELLRLMPPINTDPAQAKAPAAPAPATPAAPAAPAASGAPSDPAMSLDSLLAAAAVPTPAGGPQSTPPPMPAAPRAQPLLPPKEEENPFTAPVEPKGFVSKLLGTVRGIVTRRPANEEDGPHADDVFEVPTEEALELNDIAAKRDRAARGEPAPLYADPAPAPAAPQQPPAQQYAAPAPIPAATPTPAPAPAPVIVYAQPKEDPRVAILSERCGELKVQVESLTRKNDELSLEVGRLRNRNDELLAVIRGIEQAYLLGKLRRGETPGAPPSLVPPQTPPASALPDSSEAKTQPIDGGPVTL